MWRQGYQVSGSGRKKHVQTGGQRVFLNRFLQSPCKLFQLRLCFVFISYIQINHADDGDVKLSVTFGKTPETSTLTLPRAFSRLNKDTGHAVVSTLLVDSGKKIHLGSRAQPIYPLKQSSLIFVILFQESTLLSSVLNARRVSQLPSSRSQLKQSS